MEDIAYLGGLSVYFVRTAQGKLVKVSLANTERRSDRPGGGDPVFIHWDDRSAIVLHD